MQEPLQTASKKRCILEFCAWSTDRRRPRSPVGSTRLPTGIGYPPQAGPFVGCRSVKLIWLAHRSDNFQAAHLLQSLIPEYRQACRSPSETIAQCNRKTCCVRPCEQLFKSAHMSRWPRERAPRTTQQIVTKSSSPNKERSGRRIQTSRTTTEEMLNDSSVAIVNRTMGSWRSLVMVLCSGGAAETMLACSKCLLD